MSSQNECLAQISIKTDDESVKKKKLLLGMQNLMFNSK